MTKSYNHSPSPFEKQLFKIGKKNPEVMYSIFEDMAKLEETAHDIREQKKSEITTKVKYFKKDDMWQLTSGDYRVWYQFDEEDEIEYIKVFKKEKNKTPKREFNDIDTKKKNATPAKKVKVKEKIKSKKSKKPK